MQKNELVEYWQSTGMIHDNRVIEAFLKVDRTLFVPKEHITQAYEDHPVPIGEGQTISQPTTVMIMTQALEVKRGMQIMEIGCGSGYQAAILSHLAGDTGIIYTIERQKNLITLAKRNLTKAGITNVNIIHGDGSQGYTLHAPYDRIIVTAAAPVVPHPLLDQLNGIMVLPVGQQYSQKMIIIKKHEHNVTAKNLGEFVFVPLIGKHGFKVASS